jgi:hypothetical protein
MCSLYGFIDGVHVEARVEISLGCPDHMITEDQLEFFFANLFDSS